MIGQVFLGRYEAVRLLGEGGMGKVYLARQLDLGRQVVVKVMHDHILQEEKFRERFARNPADGPFPASVRRHALRCQPERSFRPLHRHGICTWH